MIVPDADAAESATWVRDFFVTVDARDAERVAAYYADDVRIAFGNRPVVTGRESARRSFAVTVAAFRALRHDITGLWTGHDGDYLVMSVEAQVTYTLHDGRDVTVPCTSTMRIRDDRIADYRVFIDMAPVFGATYPSTG